MKKIYRKYITELACLLFCLLGFAGCKKFLQLDSPETKISTQSAYKNDNSAAAVLTGLYAQLSYNYFNEVDLPATSLYEELSADNLALSDAFSKPALTSFYQNQLEPKYAANTNVQYWSKTYKLLYTINTSIIALRDNTALSPSVSKHLLGEALFLRAFCYFYLTNLYGEVPLILTDDYAQNSQIAKASVTTIYAQILSDLTDAGSLLDNNYVALDVKTATTERVRPNLAAVNALIARVYLYQKNFAAAEAAATKVIDQTTAYSLTPLNSVFLKNSKETIWALQPVSNGYSTREGEFYHLLSDGPDSSHPVYASASLVNSFELGDDRKTNWLATAGAGSNLFWYPAKYKVPFVDGANIPTEYTIVLRLAEQYLIRAEARNELNNTNGAIQDLNALRTRSRAGATVAVPNPLPNLSASSTQAELRTIILKERRVELFTEWGHRWFDLKRSGTIDFAMTQAQLYKGGTWSNYKALYPIPVFDILRNPAISQNLGYTN